MRCLRPFSSPPGRIALRKAQRLSSFVFILALIVCGYTRAEEQVALSRVPLAVQNGSAQLVGPYNPQQMLRLVIALKPPHIQEEEEFLSQLQDPNSSQFHQYLSEQEWVERFAPAAADEQAVVDWAQSQGLRVTQRYSSRLLVDVEASVAVIEKALSVNINTYQMGEKQYFSNDRDVSFPASLTGNVHAILGLNNIQVVRPMSAGRNSDNADYPVYSPGGTCVAGSQIQGNGNPAKMGKASSAGRKLAAPIVDGAYEPPDIYSSYGYDVQPLIGLGHCCNPLNNPNHSPRESSIAISIQGDFQNSDIQTFASTYGQAYNVQRYEIDGSAACCSDEGTLDTEWSTSIGNNFGQASSTAKVYYYMTTNWGLSTMLDGISCALQTDNARVLNMSWGGGEYALFGTLEMDAYHNVFNQMVGRGWTIVVAAGDSGSTADCETVSVSYPASDPDVVAVGGTNLSTSQGQFNYEYGWTGGSYGCRQNDGGGGGGCSAYYAAPGYQSSPACSNHKRSVPDIALNSDWLNSPQVFFFQGSWYANGGTSIAAPEISGFIAQENSYLLYLTNVIGNTCGPNGSAPCAPLGNANSYFYNEGYHRSAPHYPFYDITQGCNNNDVTQQLHLQYFCSAPGYDQVTGWGSANMFQLAWSINYALAGDGAGPSVSFSGPPVNHWYNTDQTINWTLTDQTGNGHRPNGVAGFGTAWDVDPGDPSSEPTPGAGTNFYALQSYSASGSGNGLANLSQGCHTGYVRGWDNAGNSSLSGYGPLCFDNIPPVTQILLTGNQQQPGHYTGPVLISLSATDNASGVASTWSSVDSAPFQLYAGPVYAYLPGQHCVQGYSIDVAGNQEGAELNCFYIDSNTQFSLSVTKPGTGQGTVTSMDGAINCGSICSAPYYDEQPVTLTASPSAGSNFMGWQNCDSSFGFSCTVTMTAARSVTAVFNIPVALQFVPVTPCRVVDTRGANGPFGGPAIVGGTSRDFAIAQGPCPGIPSNAAAYSLNVTVAPQGHLNYLTGWPTGFTRPQVSLMNSFDGRTKADAAILPAGQNSSGQNSISIYVTNTANVILDIDGYFITPGSGTLAFFSLPPCRVVDTRGANGPLGGPALVNRQVRDFPILQSSCGIPSYAQAYSLNVTALPKNQQPLGYLTAWPAGSPQPVVSTLNAPTGVTTANAAIVPAGASGDIDVYPSGNDTDLLIDINGYFAAPSSPGTPLSLYTFNPCRVLDTRGSGGAFNGRMTINVVNSPCDVTGAAKGYVLNATVLPSGALGYLTLWPDGQGQPTVSTLNAPDGAVTSNMAIVPTTNGSIDAYASALTQLILDISSYFAP
jgi:hypothetical protein